MVLIFRKLMLNYPKRRLWMPARFLMLAVFGSDIYFPYSAQLMGYPLSTNSNASVVTNSGRWVSSMTANS